LFQGVIRVIRHPELVSGSVFVSGSVSGSGSLVTAVSGGHPERHPELVSGSVSESLVTVVSGRIRA